MEKDTDTVAATAAATAARSQTWWTVRHNTAVCERSMKFTAHICMHADCKHPMNPLFAFCILHYVRPVHSRFEWTKSFIFIINKNTHTPYLKWHEIQTCQRPLQSESTSFQLKIVFLSRWHSKIYSMRHCSSEMSKCLDFHIVIFQQINWWFPIGNRYLLWSKSIFIGKDRLAIAISTSWTTSRNKQTITRDSVTNHGYTDDLWVQRANDANIIRSRWTEKVLSQSGTSVSSDNERSSFLSRGDYSPCNQSSELNWASCISFPLRLKFNKSLWKTVNRMNVIHAFILEWSDDGGELMLYERRRPE